MRVPIGIRVALFSTLMLCSGTGRMEAGGRLPTLIYRGGGQGKVVFDHQLHASKGLSCNDCHTDFDGTGKQLFTTRKQGLITLADHTTAAKCFACHNGNGARNDGKAAFHHCGNCHRKTG